MARFHVAASSVEHSIVSTVGSVYVLPLGNFNLVKCQKLFTIIAVAGKACPNDAIIGEALSQGDVHPFFFVRTSKFWPSLVVLKFLHNLSSAVLIFKSTHKNNNSKK